MIGRKKYFKSMMCLAFLLVLLINRISAQTVKHTNSLKILQNGFLHVPDTIKTSVYWYWINDNISKEGVVNDLKAMKKVGINRAFIGFIGLNEMPYGKVKIFSDEWWDILHTALKTATDLKIDIGIFNSPGWSQSGGPWVKANQAMRYLTSTDTILKGPNNLSIKLNKKGEEFQDVKVITYQVSEIQNLSLLSSNATITTEGNNEGILKIADGNINTVYPLNAKNNLLVNFETNTLATVRSITISPDKVRIKANVEFLVDSGNGYKSIRTFTINRTQAGLNVGFNPYGPIVISVPEQTAKKFRLVFSNANPAGNIAEIELSAIPKVERYVEKTLAKMFQGNLPPWSEYMWAKQPAVSDNDLVIHSESVKDISNLTDKNGVLNWNVPAGKWMVMRYGMVPTGTKNSPAPPNVTGYETDKMNKKHIEDHFEAFMGLILKHIPAEDRKSFKVVVADSYEQGGENWTDGFIENFKDKYHYDPVPYLPVFSGNVVNSPEISDRFLWDLRRLIADKIAYDYVGGLREAAHRHGLTSWLENYGHWGFPAEFLQYGGQSDEVGGEFWTSRSNGSISFECRAAASSSHIYGKRKVSAESFTSGDIPFSNYPATLKQRLDRSYIEGVNNTLMHVYIEQPFENKKPGMSAWFGTEVNRKNTWFSQANLFVNYIKSCNYMLQQGMYTADVAYYIGEDAPKMTGIREPELPQGYAYDYINSEVIINNLTVKDGRLVLPDGMSYRLLVLPPDNKMRPIILKKIEQLIQDGAVVFGLPPTESQGLEGYPNADNVVKEAAAQLWDKVDGKKVKYAKVGKGMLVAGLNMQETLDLLNIVPDCKTNLNVTYIHRELPDVDIYFIANHTDSRIIDEPVFRVSKGIPQLWDATSGVIRNLPSFNQSNVTTTIPLQLEPFESAFIVFKKDKQKHTSSDVVGLEANFPTSNKAINITSPWSVSFDPVFNGPANPVVFNELQDWSKNENDSIKFYSGTAIYKNNFVIEQLPTAKQHVFLELGLLSAMAKVKVNGKYAGGVFTAPWKVDITSFVKQGENKLEIEVVNTWLNRLIGDSKLPESQRITWRSTGSAVPKNTLQPSGIIGPVSINYYNYNSK